MITGIRWCRHSFAAGVLFKILRDLAFTICAGIFDNVLIHQCCGEFLVRYITQHIGELLSYNEWDNAREKSPSCSLCTCYDITNRFDRQDPMRIQTSKHVLCLHGLNAISQTLLSKWVCFKCVYSYKIDCTGTCVTVVPFTQRHETILI